jgi:hypothetical protein
MLSLRKNVGQAELAQVDHRRFADALKDVAYHHIVAVGGKPAELGSLMCDLRNYRTGKLALHS